MTDELSVKLTRKFVRQVASFHNGGPGLPLIMSQAYNDELIEACHKALEDDHEQA